MGERTRCPPVSIDTAKNAGPVSCHTTTTRPPSPLSASAAGRPEVRIRLMNVIVVERRVLSGGG
jgi:hypothetical protein